MSLSELEEGDSVPPTPIGSNPFVVEPATWVWDAFYSQANYPPKPENLAP